MRDVSNVLSSMRTGSLGCLTVSLLLTGALLAGAAEKPAVKLTGFHFSPTGRSGESRGGYVWPDDAAIDAVAVVETSGYEGELKLDLYVVVFDEKDQVFAKVRSKYSLKAGTHTLSFPAILDAAKVFGSRDFTATVEAGLKGGGSDSAKVEISISGPDPPEVEIVDIHIYNPARGKDSQDFVPGDTFVVEAVYDIRDNPGDVCPEVMLYAAMEEDSFQIDPELEYQPYTEQWDILKPGQAAGEFLLRAAGRMPRYFAEPWEHRHAMRVYVCVNFASGGKMLDYARCEVFDAYPGEARRNEDLSQRLVEMDRAYKWEVRRVRPPIS
jgi:hypothetical protein